jgi:hypothetical protein
VSLHRETLFDRTDSVAQISRGDAILGCERCICELRLATRLSRQIDSCKCKYAGVYSTTLHKGKPVARRGRKASGPTAQRRRIAGLPAAASSGSSRRHPYLSCTSPSYQSLVTTPQCGVVRIVFPHVAQACVEEEGAAQVEMGKPVERRGRKASGLQDFILRQRGCHMGIGRHVTVHGLSVRVTTRARCARSNSQHTRFFVARTPGAAPTRGRSHASLQ